MTMPFRSPAGIHGETYPDSRELRRLWSRLGKLSPRLTDLAPKRQAHLRLLSLNVAHGWQNHPRHTMLRRQEVRRNIAELAEALQDVGPDIVALQEADGPSAWSGNFDHVRTLAELAELTDTYRGEHGSFTFGRFNFESGTALLGARPLLEPVSHRFDMSWRDTKGFVLATVPVPEWGPIAIDVVSVHLDFLRPAVRRRQILHMVDRLAERRRPLVVLGDLNCCWRREPASIELLTTTLGLRAHQRESKAPTYPAARPRRRFDWILVSEDLDFASYTTVRLPHSDHLAVAADLRLNKRAWSSAVMSRESRERLEDVAADVSAGRNPQ